VSPGSATAGYEYFEVEADVGVHAWGPSLAEAFAQAALAVLALAVEPDGVAEREVREARGQGHSGETLLVDWLNQCLYVHEIEGFAVRRVEVDTLSSDLVHGFLHGEEIDRDRHRLGTVVKAATLHQASVVEAPGRFEVRVIVDV
jgi:SHS2 domain-containing protein